MRRDEKTGAGAVLFARFDGKSWTAPADAAPCTRVEPRSLAAAIDGSGSPVVVWQDLDSREPGKPGLFFTRWTGRGWTPPECLVALPVFSNTSPTACTDRQGRVHLVYQDRLKPPEEYSIGLIITDGEFPCKNWHVQFIGETWSAPAPTSGPGRYNSGEPRLSAEVDGKVYLVSTVSPFGRVWRGNHYAGCQAWDGKSWSPLERLTPEDLSAGGMSSLAVDARGTKFVTWWPYPACEVRTTRKRGDRIGPPEVVAPQGSLPALCSDEAGAVLLAWHADGSIHIVARAGDRWAPEVTFPAPHRFDDLGWTRGGTGTMFLRWATRDALYIQEIVLRLEAKR